MGISDLKLCINISCLQRLALSKMTDIFSCTNCYFCSKRLDQHRSCIGCGFIAYGLSQVVIKFDEKTSLIIYIYKNKSRYLLSSTDKANITLDGVFGKVLPKNKQEIFNKIKFHTIFK